MHLQVTTEPICRQAQGERLVKLNQIAIQQMQVLEGNEDRKLLKYNNHVRSDTGRYFLYYVLRGSDSDGLDSQLLSVAASG